MNIFQSVKSIVFFGVVLGFSQGHVCAGDEIMVPVFDTPQTAAIQQEAIELGKLARDALIPFSHQARQKAGRIFADKLIAFEQKYGEMGNHALRFAGLLNSIKAEQEISAAYEFVEIFNQIDSQKPALMLATLKALSKEKADVHISEKIALIVNTGLLGTKDLVATLYQTKALKKAVLPEINRRIKNIDSQLYGSVVKTHFLEQLSLIMPLLNDIETVCDQAIEAISTSKKRYAAVCFYKGWYGIDWMASTFKTKLIRLGKDIARIS